MSIHLEALIFGGISNVLNQEEDDLNLVKRLVKLS